MDWNEVNESLVRSSTGYKGPLPTRRLSAGAGLGSAVGLTSMNDRHARFLSRTLSRSTSGRRATDSNVDYLDAAVGSTPMKGRQAALLDNPLTRSLSRSTSVRRATDSNVDYQDTDIGSMPMNVRTAALSRGPLSRSIKRSASSKLLATDNNAISQEPVPTRQPLGKIASMSRRATDSNVEYQPTFPARDTGRPFPSSRRATDSNVELGQAARTLSSSASFSIGRNSTVGKASLMPPRSSSFAPHRFRRRTTDNPLESVAEDRPIADAGGEPPGR